MYEISVTLQSNLRNLNRFNSLTEMQLMLDASSFRIICHIFIAIEVVQMIGLLSLWLFHGVLIEEWTSNFTQKFKRIVNSRLHLLL